MDCVTFLSEIKSCNARDLEGDAIYVLVSINKFDYLSQGLPSVVVLEKYDIYFWGIYCASRCICE